MLLTRRPAPARVAGALLIVLVVGGTTARSGTAAGRFPIDIGPRPAQREVARAVPTLGSDPLIEAARTQLAAGCDPRAGVAPGRDPYAETVLGRRRPTVATGAAEARLILAALLSQDPAFAHTTTAPLRASADAGVRYLGWLIPANVAARAPAQGERLRGLLPGLAASTDGVGFSTADADYLHGLAAAAAGDGAAALGYLGAALGQEPDFFNARVLRLHLRMEALAHSGGAGHRACRDAYAALFADLLALLDLTRCPLQAAQVELYLRRFLPDPAQSQAFLAAQVYLGVIGRRPDHARLALARFDAGSGPACKRPLSQQLHGLLGLAAGPAEATQ